MALTGRFDADFQPFLDAVAQANKSLDALNETAKKLGGTVDEVAGKSLLQTITQGDLLHDAIEKALDVAKELAAYFPELAERGAVVNDVADAFAHLTEQAGLTADVLLGDLRAGTHGTVDDFELMKRANQDLTAGLNLSEDQFRLLSDAAFALAKATGGDVSAALDKMSDAMVTGRVEGIALLTGKIDLKAAEADYAASLEGTGRQLTAEGKLELDRQTILAAIEKGLGRLGEQQDSLKDKTDQARVAWKNFQDELGGVIAKSPVLNAGLDAMRNALINAFGGDQETAIKNIAKAIDEAGIIVVDFGLATLTAATVAHTAWALTETIVVGAATAMGGAISLLLELAVAAAKATAFLSPSPIWDETVSKLEAVRDSVEVTTVSLGRFTAEAAKGVTGQSAFDKTIATLGGTLFNTRDAMIAAQAALDKHTDSTKKNADATDKNTASQKGLGDQTTIQTEYTKKFDDAWTQLNSTGEDYQATIDQMNPKLVEMIGYYLKLGHSVQTVAAGFPEATEAQVKAIDVMQKRMEAAALSVEKIWNEYNDVVGTGSQTAYKKAEAAIDKWYADDVAKHVAAKIDTQESYEAITALDQAKYAALAANRIADDKDSRQFAENKAHADQEAYQFAMDHLDQFTQAHVQKLKEAADASSKAAAAWGTSWGDAADKAAAGVDKVTGAVDAVTSSIHALGATGDMAEQQALASVMKGVDASGIGQMMKMGTTNVNTMNAYEAAIEQGMAALGYGVQPRAAGGPVSAGAPYLVGESGPELFVPSSGGAIVPNTGMGGVNLTIHVTSPLGTPAAIATAVSAALADAMRRSGVRLPSQ